MPSRLRKVRRLRGSRTHTWGQITQHRHSGARGGTGMAGLHKHKWSYTVKYMPDHFGHNNFSPPKKNVTKRWLNLDDLPLVLRDSKSGDTADLGKMGYEKLLGGGKVENAYKLMVPRASTSAIEKVKAAGGSVEVTEASEEPNTDSQPKSSKGESNKQAPPAKGAK